MDFHKESIDFLKTYNNYEKKYGPRVVCRKSFCAPIVRMAVSVIHTYFDQGSLKGVKSCLEYEIGRISWRNNLWILPLWKTELFFHPLYESDRKVISLLSDSLIVTVIAYRIQLDQTQSGLANLIFSDITLGFEWVCDWTYRGVKINPTENPLIETHDIERLKKFIY